MARPEAQIAARDFTVAYRREVRAARRELRRANGNWNHLTTWRRSSKERLNKRIEAAQTRLDVAREIQERRLVYAHVPNSARGDVVVSTIKGEDGTHIEHHKNNPWGNYDVDRGGKGLSYEQAKGEYDRYHNRLESVNERVIIRRERREIIRHPKRYFEEVLWPRMKNNAKDGVKGVAKVAAAGAILVAGALVGPVTAIALAAYTTWGIVAITASALGACYIASNVALEGARAIFDD